MTILKASKATKALALESIYRNQLKSPECHYVYIHLLDGVVIYVGRGSHDRAVRVKGRSKAWYDRAVEKLSRIEAEIVTGLMSIEEAGQQEKKYIQLYGDTCINYQHAGEFGKPVLCFTREGVIVKEYEYVIDVEADNFFSSCVINCCRGRRGLHANHVWMYKDDYLQRGFHYKIAKNHAREIEQIRPIDGFVVRTLLTAVAFADYGFDPNNIQQVCAGSKKTHAGFEFRYVSK